MVLSLDLGSITILGRTSMGQPSQRERRGGKDKKREGWEAGRYQKLPKKKQNILNCAEQNQLIRILISYQMDKYWSIKSKICTTYFSWLMLKIWESWRNYTHLHVYSPCILFVTDFNAEWFLGKRLSSWNEGTSTVHKEEIQQPKDLHHWEW